MTQLPKMSPFDEVRAQLARQKWAVDFHDADALPNLYASDCVLIIRNEGVGEAVRVRGRANVIEHMLAGWRANTSWKPGHMIHHIGTQLVEPGEGGSIRCWSYAAYVHLEPSGSTVIHGYGKYFDTWILEDDVWRIAEREVHLFGIRRGATAGPSQEDN
jgi:hypothetical protein